MPSLGVRKAVSGSGLATVDLRPSLGLREAVSASGRATLRLNAFAGCAHRNRK